MERFFPADKIVLTGNPVRRNLLLCPMAKEDARRSFGLDPDRRTILVVGGSLGARTVNESIVAALPMIAATADVQVIWQTGKYYDLSTREALEKSPAKNVVRMPFISNMDVAYRAADLVVSRAGASSISELQLLGKPSILVPSPNVAEDHQTKNALALADRGAAIMVRDAESVEKLGSTMLATVHDEALLAKLAANVEKMALRNADERIVDCVMKIITK